MADLSDPNDLGAPFVAHRQDMGTDALIAEARARQAAATKPAGPAADGSTKTATVGRNPDGTMSLQVQSGAPAAPAGAPNEKILGVTPLPAGSAPPKLPPGAKTIVDQAGNQINYSYDAAGNFNVLSVIKGAVAVAKDIGSGIVHAPMQILGGIGDAGRNAFKAGDELGNWLNDNVADLRLPSTGNDALDTALGHPGGVIAAGIPKAPAATSVTGGLIRDTAEFLTGFLPAMRMTKAVGLGKVAGSVVAGGAASATVLDPLQSNLANLVEKFPVLHNPVTEYLAAQPDDSAGEARFKKAIEGAGMGALAEGFVLAVRALRAARMAKVAPSAVADNLDAARAIHGEVRPEEAMIGGTAPDAPLVAVEHPAGAKIDQALAATETGVPTEVAATGVAKSAAEADGAKPAQAGTPAATGQVVGPGAMFSDPTRLPSGADVDAMIAEKGMSNDAKLLKALGSPERVKLFKRLDRAMNGTMDPPKADAASAQFDKEFGNLTPDQERLIYGMGETDYQVDELKTIRSAINDTGFGAPGPETAKEAAGQVTQGLRDFSTKARADVFGALRGDYGAGDQAAAIRFTRAFAALRESVPDKAAADAQLLGAFGRAGFKPGDAEEMLASYMGDVAKSQKPGAGLAAPAAEAAPRETGLRTAIIDENGVTHIGEPGEMHVDLAEKMRPGAGMLAADTTKWQIGFAGPDGKFLTRDQAARAAGVDTRAAGSREADALVGKPVIGQPKVMINFDRIATADDVKKVISDTVQAFAPGIDEARRGVRSNEATQDAADALGMSVPDLLSRRRGQPMSAEEAVAARGLWAASADKLLELANIAASPNAGAVDQFKFRRMLAVHYAIQAEVIGARTETARALQSWSMPVGGGNIERARAIEQMLAENGGADVSNMLAKRLAALSKAGVDPAAMNAAIRQGAFAKTVDTVREIWINGLLSSPTTHIVNTTSNTVTALAQAYERAAAGQVSTLIGRAPAEGGVMPGEASAMTYGLVAGLKDAFTASWKSMISGETGQTLGKIDLPQRAISSEAYGIASGTPLGKTVDFIGSAFRLPGRALGAEDEFFKSVGYRMELQAQAYRQASQEGLAGGEMTSRIADIVANPPENIRLAAADQALYQTFNNAPGEWGKTIMAARGKIPPLALVLPFVRTPINILRYSLERSIFAPAVAQWRADVAAGGARADLAIARMGTGSAVMGLAFDYAESGVVSGGGPKDPGERQALVRQGWQPYSVFVNGKWYSYNRTDPFGMTMGFAADFAEALRQGQPATQQDVSQWNQVLAGGIAMVGNNAINKTYLQGFANFVTMMQDPTRYAEPYVNNLLASFVPYSGALRTVERFVDPTVRAARGMDEDTVGGPLLAQIESGIPGLSKNLIPERDLWGKEIKPDNAYGRAYDVLSPVKVSVAKPSPIDAELWRVGYTPTRIPLKASIAGVPIDMGRYPQAYDDWVRLAGNDLKLQQYDNLGAKDFLDSVVKGKSGNWSQIYGVYSDGPEGGKADFIKGVISQYRQAAANQVLADPKNGDLRRVYDQRRSQMELNKMPIPMQQQMPAGGMPMPVIQ